MTQSELAQQIIQKLSTDEDQRVRDFQGLIRSSAEDDWAYQMAIEMYRQAGSGDWDVSSIVDAQMVLSSVQENPALLPIVEADINRMVERLDRIGRSYRATWTFLRKKVKQRKTASRHSREGEAA